MYLAKYYILFIFLLNGIVIYGQADCINYKREISKIKNDIQDEMIKYRELNALIDDFDSNTRVNFCTQSVDRFTDIAVLEFDNSWNNYLSNLSDKIGYFQNIPLVGDLVDAISDKLSYLILGLDVWESEQMSVDKAIKEYNDIRDMRNDVIENMVKVLEKHYCAQIIQLDKRLYELYNSDIESACDAFEASQLKQEITYGRPNDLPKAIWNKAVFEVEAKKCNISYNDIKIKKKQPRTDCNWRFNSGSIVTWESWNPNTKSLEGWYNVKNNTLKGTLKVNKDGNWVFNGEWGRKDSNLKGKVELTFSDAHIYTGYYISSIDGKPKNWPGQVLNCEKK